MANPRPKFVATGGHDTSDNTFGASEDISSFLDDKPQMLRVLSQPKMINQPQAAAQGDMDVSLMPASLVQDTKPNEATNAKLVDGLQISSRDSYTLVNLLNSTKSKYKS